MSNNVTTYWLTSVSSGEECRGSWVRLDLVGDEDGDVELFGHTLQTSEVLA